MAGTEQPQEPVAREGEHVAPGFQEGHFHCPRCGVLAAQNWIQLESHSGSKKPVWWSTCTNCTASCIWVTGMDGGRMIEPLVGGGPRPHVDMPEDVRKDYEEARAILQLSPRGACALNRLAVQKLVDDLEPGKAKLNDKIGALVAQGDLNDTVKYALDALRVIGNNAVHPGELVLDDDVETATALFECMNTIVEDRVAKPKRMQKLYDKLPQGAKDAIAKRDGTPASTT